MNPVDPDAVVFDHISPEGVVGISYGCLASIRLRETSRDIVRALDDEGWQEYRRRKYGRSSTPTPEERRAAYAYLLERASKIAVDYYVRLDYGTPA